MLWNLKLLQISSKNGIVGADALRSLDVFVVEKSEIESVFKCCLTVLSIGSSQS